MVGKADNGLYSAAITCVAVLQFVYVAVVDSFRPLILTEKKENSAGYENNVSRLYGLIIYMSLAQAVVFFVFADLIVHVLYGAEFAGAIPILRILVLYFVFSAMGLVRNVWILAEEKQKYLWIINLSGAVFNIVLNAALIPFFGAVGAAVASLLTQFFANFVLGFIIKPLRHNNKLMLLGMNPKYIFTEIKFMLKEMKSK
jgi:O-antigen/teichoic acid export membrane protein